MKRSGLWILFLGAIAAAVIAGVILDWLNKQLNSPANQCGIRCAWHRAYFTGPALPNLNACCGCTNPASAYQMGSPVTNYRPFLRVGQMELPAQ
jgi:hypothetical protein